MTEQNENARLKIISSYSIRVIYARYVLRYSRDGLHVNYVFVDDAFIETRA